MPVAGEISAALLDSALALHTPTSSPTLRELAHHAQVGEQAATMTVKNLVRARKLHIVRTRKVDYRNKPVAEYMPALALQQAPFGTDTHRAGEGWVQLDRIVGGWAR